MNDAIQDLIDQALIRPDRVGSGKWKPSSFGYCYRRQYWERKGEKVTNPPDKRTLRVFKAGSLFHDFVEGLLKEKHADIQTEVLIETDDTKGYADIVNGDEVTDVKSIHSQGFTYLDKTSDIKKEKYNNWLQLATYAVLLNKPRMRLVFVSKDDLRIQEYSLPVDEYWKCAVDTELLTLNKYWNFKELPPAQPRCFKQKDGTFKECEKYCPFYDKCVQTENARAVDDHALS